jgi:hypothetical protein
MDPMPEVNSSLENRVEELSHRVEFLSQEFATLSAKVAGLAEGTAHLHDQLAQPPAEVNAVPHSSKDQNITTVLSTIATVSFLLVVALVLRTIVDNGVVNRQFGSYLGLLYAVLLVAHSFHRYSRGRPHVPVYSTCGALLIFSIVYESQSRFHTFSAPAAYTILMATLIAMGVLGLRFVIPTAVTIGALGAGAVGLALEFPNPHFVWLAALILLANFLAHYARRISECAWLRWATLLMTLFFWSLWTTKLRAEFLHGRTPAPEMGLDWLAASLALFMIAYVALVARSAARADLPFAAFERILPVVNVTLVFAVAFRIASAGWGNVSLVGTVGVGVAILHFALAYFFSGRGENGAKATTAFTLAALTLLALALPVTPIERIWVVGIWCIAALTVGFFSGRWANGDVRALSYGHQFFACGMAISLGWLAVASPLPMGRLVAALALALGCFVHYWWCRCRAPVVMSGGIASWDPADRAAVVPFFVALVYGFVAARIALYALLPESGQGINAVFLSGQSVLINLSSLLLLLWGIRRDNSEIQAVAFAVALIGAFKVFGYDFLKIQGVELVASVFSFGVTAGVGSLIWRSRQSGS